MSQPTKTKIKAIEPVAAEADVMVEFATLKEVLSATHTQIPRLLARQREADRQLGLEDTEESRKRLERIESERRSASRRRAATIASILELQPELEAARAEAEKARQRVGIAALSAFRMRWNDKVAELQALASEGEALSRLLRVTVPMAWPQRPSVSAVAEAVSLKDAEIEALSQRLDEIDSALSVCQGARNARELDARHNRLALLRNGQTEYSGTFQVLMPFTNFSGEFKAGELVDASLLGHGLMSRLQTGKRYIQPVEIGTVAAA